MTDSTTTSTTTSATGRVTIRSCRRDEWDKLAKNEYAMWRDKCGSC